VKLIAVIILLAFFQIFTTPARAGTKEVVVIGTFHGDHNLFPLYNFETLRIVIEHLQPDLLIIEEDPKTFAEKWYEKLSEEDYTQKRPIEIRKVICPMH